MKNNLNAVLTEVDKHGDLSVKDNYLTQGVRTTAGSRVLDNYIPQYSSTVVTRLQAAGHTIKAKVNLDAWAHGSSGENSAFKPTKNPWNPKYTPGGSSSGSAVAVAAGLSAHAIGSDTGGSIRLPASFTNTTALKPTYGALSRYGIVAMASSLDCPSVLSTSVKEVKKLFSATNHSDDKDATSHSPLRNKSHVKKKTHYTFGLPKEYYTSALDPEVTALIKQAVTQLTDHGHTAIPISLPHTKYGIAVYYLIQTTEVASNLARYDGIRYGNDRSHFAAEAERRIILGTFSSSAGYSDKYYEKAAQVRTLIIKDFDTAFTRVDAILAPVSPTPPFKLGEKTADPLQMYLSDALTVNMNLAGIPALAVPAGFTQNGLPVGMQFVGPRWSESLLFDMGEKYQSITDWHTRKPAI